MFYKKYFYMFLGLGIIFSSSNNLNAMSNKKALLYTGLSALGFVGATHIVYNQLDKFGTPQDRDFGSAIFKLFACVATGIIGLVLYTKTPKFVLKRAKELYKEACKKSIFFIAKSFHGDYEGLMEKIDTEYQEYANPLIDAYKDLEWTKNQLKESKSKFDTIKKLVLSGEVSKNYSNKHNIDIEKINDYIEQIDVFLKHIFDTMNLIKKHPNYLEALKIEKQNQLIEKQNEIANELWWFNLKTPFRF